MTLSEYLLRMVKGFWTLIVGLGVTFKWLFRKPFTVEYPYEKLAIPAGYHGYVKMIYDDRTGITKCVACMLCVKACPVACIEIDAVTNPETKKKLSATFKLNYSTCMYCNLCIEACNFDAIVMSPIVELSVYDRSNLLLTLCKDTREFQDLAHVADAERPVTTHSV